MENTLLENLLYAVEEQGARFIIDLKERTLKVNGKAVVYKGKYDGPTGLSLPAPEEFIARVEELYQVYKHSIPSQRSESRRKRYFKALSESELADESMMFGPEREMVQAALEGYILCCLLEGLTWHEQWGKWFWQSTSDPDLVLLREWFE